MSYFATHEGALQFSRDGVAAPGLRKSQRAAALSLASHFSMSTEPALVTLPTGAGKTAVLMMVPYMLPAKRALIITSSKVVRIQIADDFKGLETLNYLNVIADSIPKPKLAEVKGRIKQQEDWDVLKNFDVLVSTPNTVSPGLQGIPMPADPDLFDCILFDEAHHVPAKSWRAILDAFPGARVVLFTATPYRRDRKEVPGDFVFNYSVGEAFADGVYKPINYFPVTPAPGQSKDEAIAKAAEAQLLSDRAKGLDHRILIRTGDLGRAEALRSVYSNTSLNCPLLTSKQSDPVIRQLLADLRAGKVDGVITVDMLAEGFDMPALKIAAMHHPHKSIEVTLQFIGRLARVGANLGTASAFAIPNEIEFMATQLYREGAVWSVLIPNLSSAKVGEELQVKQLLSRFKAPPTQSDAPDLSLYDIRPYAHVRVFRTKLPPNIDSLPEFKRPLTMPWYRVNPSDGMAAYMIQETRPVKWASNVSLVDVRNHIILVYFDKATSLLFINSTLKEDAVYEAALAAFGKIEPRRLAMDEVDAVLANIADPQCIGVGLASIDPLASGDSYKNYMGSNADDSVTGSDAAGYVLGHVQAKGKENGKATTIGYAGSSKIWANKWLSLFQFSKWAELQAQKIVARGKGLTLSTFDSIGRPTMARALSAVPLGIVWNKAVLFEPLVARLSGTLQSEPLCELELLPKRDTFTAQGFELELVGATTLAVLKFDLSQARPYSRINPSGDCSVVNTDTGEIWAIESFLNDLRPDIVLADGSRTDGTNYSRPASLFVTGLLQGDVTTVDWGTEKVPINKEITAPKGFLSIQAWMTQHLTPNYELVICDHGRGEVADIIAFKQDGDAVRVVLCHCKGSKKAYVGDREEDLYDLCMQCVKSARFLRGQDLIAQLKGRLKRKVAELRKGDAALVAEFEKLCQTSQFSFQMILVQPGISAGGMGPITSGLIGYAKDSCKARADSFRFYCSA